jgi:hypothetical protein
MSKQYSKLEIKLGKNSGQIENLNICNLLAPVAFKELALVASRFSILSVNNLPKVPMVEMIIVNTPANGPGPTAMTKMSTIIKLGTTLIKDSNHLVIILISLLLKI